ncbi:MAG: hypothetical protein AAFR16_08880 [Pseudomonadota bacterium]
MCVRHFSFGWTGALVAAALVAASALASPLASAETTPSGAPVVTVVGQVGRTNRDRFEPFSDAFFNYHEKSFTRAFAFDRVMLQALPQHEITVEAEGWPRAVTLRGPRLRSVLAEVAAKQGAGVSLMALDGYAIELSAAELNGMDWIVALSADGAPLGIGGRGPTWIAHSAGDGPASAELEARWIWSVFLIEVK